MRKDTIAVYSPLEKDFHAFTKSIIKYIGNKFEIMQKVGPNEYKPIQAPEFLKGISLDISGKEKYNGTLLFKDNLYT